MKNCLEQFSCNLFWDVRREEIDMERNATYVVQRVVEYGTIDDWKLLLNYYGLERIVNIAKGLRSLDPRALSYLAVISRTPREEFRCYTLRQSNPAHCNF